MKLKHIVCTLMAGCTLFATEEPVSLSLFKELAVAQKGNVLFSPACFEEALLYVGKYTAGQTRAELKAMRFWARDEYTSMYPQVAAALFVADDMKLKPIKKAVVRVPFSTDPGGAVQKINTWVNKATRGMIPAAVDSDAVGQYTRFFVVSALTLQEGWVETFADNLTKPNYPFTMSDGTVVKVPMMTAEDSTSHRYAEGDDWQAVRLLVMPNKKSKNRYAGSFIAIRPRGDVREFAAKLTPELLEHIYKELARPTSYVEGDKMYVRYTDVMLPCFSLSPAQVNLAPYMQKLGVCSLFCSQADFSHLTEEKGVHLDFFIQKNGLDVHEEGFNAVSVTWGGPLGAYREPVEQHFSITFDKPFIFIIGTMHSQVRPFFMGICENPAVGGGATVYADNAVSGRTVLLDFDYGEPLMRLLEKSPWAALFEGKPDGPCFVQCNARKLKAGTDADALLQAVEYQDAVSGDYLKLIPICRTTVKEDGKVYIRLRAAVDFSLRGEHASCDSALGVYYAYLWFEITEEIAK
ncbi:MAG: hypothetical protein IKZ10_07190 [Akkermansia sp.]|nr:hypothetical protein [Akkermansia sp.]